MTLNLDQLAAQRAQEMVGNTPKDKIENLERLATKALGVLQEQGVYAFMLFLFSRTSDEKVVSEHVRKQLYQALVSLPGFSENGNMPKNLASDNPKDVLSYYADTVLDDLDQLLLVRDLYEQILIYSRFGAKAVGG